MTHFEKEYYLENHGHYNLEFVLDGYDTQDLCVRGVYFCDVVFPNSDLQQAAEDFMETNEDRIIQDYINYTDLLNTYK